MNQNPLHAYFHITDYITIVIYALIFFVCMLLIPIVTPVFTAAGSSMEPTIMDGDYCLLNTFAYRHKEPERYDVITFHNDCYDLDLCKRIYGLPGETVMIDEDGNILINGKVIEDKVGADQVTDPGTAFTPITLGKYEYFVLGDNREVSIDSRFVEVGLVRKQNIKGKDIFWFTPFWKKL